MFTLGAELGSGSAAFGRGSTLWVLGLRFGIVFVSPGFGGLDCGGASPGFGASPGLSLRFWSLIELLSLIKNTLGLFLFRLGLGAWIAEGLLLVLGLLLIPP